MASLGFNKLTHLPLDKMAIILQTTFSKAFSWTKSLYFFSNFTEVYSQGSNWQWVSIGSGNGLSPVRCQAIPWTNADPIRWRIYAALGGDGLMKSSQTPVLPVVQDFFSMELTEKMSCWLRCSPILYNHEQYLGWGFVSWRLKICNKIWFVGSMFVWQLWQEMSHWNAIYLLSDNGDFSMNFPGYGSIACMTAIWNFDTCCS